MEKLLHERLRETTDLCCTGEMIAHVIGIGPLRCKGLTCDECVKILMSKLGDEIEKYYIPRPRFEDGEPVQFGDEVELHYKGGGCDKGVMQSFHPNRGTVWMLSFVGWDHERLVRYDSESDVLKRPASKVLDADGVEIKVGDTVWSTGGGRHGTVESVPGLTKFDKVSARNCTVLWDGNICADWCQGEKLTHREPDSLAKAMERFQSILEDKDGLDYEVEEKLWDVHKRLTALIERGA